MPSAPISAMTRKARHRCRTGADAPGLNFRNPDRIDMRAPFHRSDPAGRPSVAIGYDQRDLLAGTCRRRVRSRQAASRGWAGSPARAISIFDDC
jgi:hypothetical protein